MERMAETTTSEETEARQEIYRTRVGRYEYSFRRDNRYENIVDIFASDGHILQMKHCVISSNTDNENMKNFSVKNWGYSEEQIGRSYFDSKQLDPSSLPLEREAVLKRAVRAEELMAKRF